MSRPVVAITGAAAGIGRAIAERFAADGWMVGAFDVDGDGVRKLVSHMEPGQGVAEVVDVRDAEAFAAAIGRLYTSGGSRLDVLVNNAGVLETGHFEDVPLDRYRRMIDINLAGVVTGCHVSFDYLRQTPKARVINLASASAFFGTPSYAVYSATKSAVKALTEALSVEWRSHDIKVMDVLPLFVDTDMVAGAKDRVSIDRMGVRLTAKGIADCVWRAAHSRSGKLHWIPGAQTQAIYMMMRASPVWLSRWVGGRLSGY